MEQHDCGQGFTTTYEPAPPNEDDASERHYCVETCNACGSKWYGLHPGPVPGEGG